MGRKSHGQVGLPILLNSERDSRATALAINIELLNKYGGAYH